MIEIRPYKTLDEDFIYHSWLASVDYNIPGVQRMTRLVIDTCVQDGTILVACSDEDPDHILGWLGYTEKLGYPTLLYAFVKKKLRNHGIGGKLIRAKFPGEGTIPTAFWSYWCQKYNLKRKWGLRFNSLLLPVLVDRVHGETETQTSDES